jgi:UDPglucose--hexose-1-phosphate uridylyltransferase
MHRSDYVKPDGRRLWLYARQPFERPNALDIPVPDPTLVEKSSHLRWHPLIGEWVAYATHRQDRTFLPPAETNPLAPTIDLARPTELPAGDWEVAVFENRFPSLSEHVEAPEVPGVTTAPGRGRCEVVVFAQDAAASLAALPVERIALILEVWGDRTRELAHAGCAYVLPFENRGVEMGVTLHHPHGQIYGYGFLPALQARTAAALVAHHARTGSDLVCKLAEGERALGTRVVVQRTHATAFVPPFARFPFETWITPRRAAPDLAGLTPPERADLAACLKEALQRLDGLWQRPMPYLLTVNQKPTGLAGPGWTVRIEIWPVRRAREKLKYLAGTELGAGVFASDMTPETAAAQLRALAL